MEGTIATSTRVRRGAAALTAAAAVAAFASGCGDGNSAKDPLDDALGYLPANAPLVIGIDTNPDGGQIKTAQTLIAKFPFGNRIVDSAKQQFQKGGASFDQVKAVLGNEAVIGAPNAAAISNNNFVGALKAKDEGKANDLVSSGSQKVGESHGATIYHSGNTFAAVNDGVIVISNSKQNLENALDQRDQGDRLREDKFDEAFPGLPKDALVRVYGDAQTLLESNHNNARTTQAQKVKWVQALRTFGLTASVQDDGLEFGFSVNTDPSGLTEGDVPLATGSESPPILARSPDSPEISVGIRDLAAIYQFGEHAAQQANPAGYSRFQAAKNQIRRRAGIDVNTDLVSQLSGNAAFIFQPGGGFAMRSDLQDPGKMKDTLAKFAKVAPSVAQGSGLGKVGKAAPNKGESLYALARNKGGQIVYGVVSNAFVAGTDAAKVADAAARETTTVPGAKGAAVLSVNAKAVADKEVEKRLGGLQSLGAGLFTAPLGDLTGSAQADTSGVRGTLKLKIQ